MRGYEAEQTGKQIKSYFIGEVVEIKESDRGGTIYVKFKVEKYCKGVKTQMITVSGAPGTTGACGLPVEIGKKYLIYAAKDGGDELSSSFCASRGLDRAAEDLAFPGKGKMLKSNE